MPARKLSNIGVAIALLAAMPSPAQTPSPPAYRFSSGSAARDIPIELIADGLVFVQVSINDHPGWFILDNATQGFLADQDYARRISLETASSSAARGGGPNQIRTGLARDVRIGLPGLELTHRNLVVISLKTLEPAVGHQVDGIIGSRLFDDFVVGIDYEHRRVSISLPAQYEAFPKATAFPVVIDSHGFPFLDARVRLPGAEPFIGRFLIDGGANSYADIYKPFADAHHIPPSAMKLQDEPGTSTGGTTESRDGRADEIGVGIFSIGNPPITFAQDTEGLMAAGGYAGLIGAEFLQRFIVVFDNPGKRLLLTPNGHYKDVAEYDQSGLRIRAEGLEFHKFIVSRIVPRSPATEAGIQPGDTIESVGDRSANELTLTEIRSMLRRPNERYEIAVMRGQEHLRFTVKLRPLL
jgi:hypothetical protein